MTLDPLAATDAWSRAWTVAARIRFSGIGLHSGLPTAVRVVPAPSGHGLAFHRVDLPGAPAIPALAHHVADTLLSTTLAVDEARVQTVEHFLAALWGLGITDARLEAEGPEIPVLDGSALPFVEGLVATGIRVLDGPRPLLALGAASRRDGAKSLTVTPDALCRVTYEIDFDHRHAGLECLAIAITPAVFAREIAPARTFGFRKDVEALRSAGLARGGSLDNAIVLDDDGPSTPLRFPDELVRHKILDLVGDMALVGAHWTGHIHAIKAGHQLHTELAHQLSKPAAPELRSVAVD